AEGEAGKLDEDVLDRDIAAADAIEQVATEAANGRRRRADRRRVGVAEVIELEVALGEGSDDAVFAGGTGIDRECHTGTALEVIRKPVALAGVAVPGGSAVRATGVHRGVDAQITADLDAGIGAGDVPESGTVQGADPHVF